MSEEENKTAMVKILLLFFVENLNSFGMICFSFFGDCDKELKLFVKDDFIAFIVFVGFFDWIFSFDFLF
jgi:hypothetical protein